ncbi:MAG: flavodoxin [Clostridiales bacterium]|nr:flavodoxin [Clostridiales bacterium]
MKIAVRYQSIGGNTKSVAEAIANKVGVKAEPITVPLNKPVDFLFIGGGVYQHGLDDSLKNYLKNLDAAIVKVVAAFSTAGVMDGAKRIASIVKEKGIPVHAETLPMKLGVRNHGTFVHKGFIDLTNKELAAVNDFVKKVIG